MPDRLLDSCVVIKLFLAESDSPRVRALIDDALQAGDRIAVIDLAYPECTNAIWKAHRFKNVDHDEAMRALRDLEDMPFSVVEAQPLLRRGLQIAMSYGRSAYDALFVAAAEAMACDGITCDEPLYNAVHHDFPNMRLLRTL